MRTEIDKGYEEVGSTQKTVCSKQYAVCRNGKLKLPTAYLLLFTVFLLLTVYCILSYRPVFASQAEDEVARIQKAYEHIRDIRGNFVQKSYIKDLKRTDTYQGRFFIKPPKMKWEYKGARPQVVYVTGEDIIIYQKKEKQVFTSKFDRATYGQAPLALLSGFGNINKEFDVSVRNGRLFLKPKKPMGNISSVEISAAKEGFPIEALIIIDTLSNRIDITLRDVRTNTGVSDKTFEFHPPEGVTILQQ